MSTETEIVSALRRFEASDTGPWGTHAARIAEGVQHSGVPALLGSIRDASNAQQTMLSQQQGVLSDMRTISGQSLRVAEQTQSSIMAMSAVMATGLGAVCRGLAALEGLLNGIQELLANPLSTAAAERYRRGIHALSQGWHEPALRELDASIEQDPFQSLSYLARGLALGALERDEEALAAFHHAVTYTGKDPSLRPVAAGASILAAQAARKLGRDDEALRTLRAASQAVPDCAEIWLAIAHLSGEASALQSALQLAPELSIVAIVGGIPQAQKVANAVASEPSGPVQSMLQAIVELDAADVIRMITINGPSVQWPSGVPEATSFHPTWRDAHVRRAVSRAQDQIRYGVDRAEKALQDARERVKSVGRRPSIWFDWAVFPPFWAVFWFGFLVMYFDRLMGGGGWELLIVIVALVLCCGSLGLTFTAAVTAPFKTMKDRRRWEQDVAQRRRALGEAQRANATEAERASHAQRGLVFARQSIPRRTFPLMTAQDLRV